MFADAKQLLEANLGPGRRTTVLNARGTPVGRAAGRPGYWVYGREHQPCLRCRTPIRHGVLGKSVPGRSITGIAAPGGGVAGIPASAPAVVTEERDIYFCPTCQPLLDGSEA
jgi:endonuclease-8